MDSSPEDTDDRLWYESLIERFEAHGWVLKTDLSRFPSTAGGSVPEGDYIRMRLPETTASITMTLEPGEQPSPRIILRVPIDAALELHDPTIDGHPFATAVAEAHRVIATKHATETVRTYTSAETIASAALAPTVGAAAADAAVRALTSAAHEVDQLHTTLFDQLDAYRAETATPVEEGVREAFGLDEIE